MASLYTRLHTGDMISKVMNTASDVITWLGGNCCVPSACRSSPSTTVIRTKQVVIINMAGARLTTANSANVSRADEMPCGLIHSSGPPNPAGSPQLLFPASPSEGSVPAVANGWRSELTGVAAAASCAGGCTSGCGSACEASTSGWALVSAAMGCASTETLVISSGAGAACDGGASATGSSAATRRTADSVGRESGAAGCCTNGLARRVAIGGARLRRREGTLSADRRREIDEYQDDTQC